MRKLSPRPGPSRSRRTARTAAGLTSLALAGAMLTATGAAANASDAPAADGPVVAEGSGGYLTTPPGATPGMGCNTDSRAYLTADAPSTPVPTNDWWSSLVFRNGTVGPCDSVQPLYADPAAYQPNEHGMGVSYPTDLQLSQYEYHYPFHEDLTVGVVGLDTTGVKVAGWTDWTVTTETDDGTHRLRSTFGSGLPFSWYEAQGGDAQITLGEGTTTWFADGARLGLTVGAGTPQEHSFVLFAPLGTTWTAGDGTYTAPAGSFSVAALPDVPDDQRAAVVEQYAPYAYSPVTDTHVTWSYDEATAQVTVGYHVVATPWPGAPCDETGAVVAMFPHQARVLTGATASALTYTSPRGAMPVLVGGQGFTTVDTFHGVLPEIPGVATSTGSDRVALENFLDQVASDPLGKKGEDTYWTGKALGRASRIVEIADQLGRTQQRDATLAAIRDELTDWFTAQAGKTQHVFAYDDQWQTLIGYPASYGSDSELNDHHFHYGYFVAAAATLARFDPGWAQQYGPMVDTLIRDANDYDRDETRFPFLRDFDVYAGHDWASGDAPFGAGNNQESSSEGMNFDGALIEWGVATGNTAVRDAGIYMYTTQAAAINSYWFNAHGDAFPAGYDFQSVGMVWGDGGAYATWFSGEPEMVSGINTLPITGSHLYLGDDPATVRRVYEFMEQRNGGPPTQWQDILWEYLALGDPDAALAKLTNNTSFASEEGESMAHTFHWIRNLAALGTVDTSVTADSPLAAVFVKDGVRTYVATNASSGTETVTFSDGTTLAVESGTTATTGGFTWVGGDSDGGGGDDDGGGGDEPPSTTPLAPLTLTSDLTLSTDPGAAGTVDLASASTSGPGTPTTFTATGLTAHHVIGATGFSVGVNAGTSVGLAVRARVSYDWTGDGTVDRVETYPYLATDPIASTVETYTSSSPTVDGAWGDLDGGTVTIELWSDLPREGTLSVSVGGVSTLSLPFATPDDDQGGSEAAGTSAASTASLGADQSAPTATEPTCPAPTNGGDDSGDGSGDGDGTGGSGSTGAEPRPVVVGVVASTRGKRFGGRSVVRVRVSAPGRSVAGTVVVRTSKKAHGHGKKVTRRVQVPAKAAADGRARVRVRLPKRLGVGKHRVRVRFRPAAGTHVLAPARVTARVKVKRAKVRWGKVRARGELRVGARGHLVVRVKARHGIVPRGRVQVRVRGTKVGAAKVRHRHHRWVARVTTRALPHRGTVTVRLTHDKHFTRANHKAHVKIRRARR